MSCCEKWAKARSELVSVGPLGTLNKSDKDGQIDKQENGLFAVVGCCGGCYVLKDLTHCPWCGAKVSES